MRDRYLLPGIMLFLLLLHGCASVPPATIFHTGTQKKMQAARHWDVLAQDITKKIKATIDQNPELAFKNVCLETDDHSPFGETFKELLKFHLFKQGITLTDNTTDAIHLDYKTKLIHHNADRTAGDFVSADAMAPGAVLLGTGASFGLAAVLRAVDYSSFAASQSTLVGAAAGFGAAGLLEMAIASQYTSITNTEYMFAAEISYSSKIYDMYLDIYYINSEDAYQYFAQVNKTPYKSDTVLSGKNIGVVDDHQDKAHAKR